MLNMTYESLCKNIVEIRERIEKKQEKYKLQYCVESPESLLSQVFELVLEIEQEINAFNVTNHYALRNFNFLNPILNTENIVKKIREMVGIVKNNYYSYLAYFVMEYVFNLSQKDLMKPIKKELTELKESISVNKYINSHGEYSKIAEFMALAEAFDEIYTELDMKKIYKLIGIQKILEEYENHLDDVLRIEDINLKRAVYTYITRDLCFNVLNSIEKFVLE